MLASAGAEIARSAERPLFELEDWKLFRSPGTIGTRAGVEWHDIPGLVAKELVDNALDAGGDCRLHHDRSQGHLVVRDSGPGIDGDDATIAELFSISFARSCRRSCSDGQLGVPSAMA